MFEEMEEAGSNLPMMIQTLKERGWVNYKHHDNWIHPRVIGEYSTYNAYQTEIVDVTTAAAIQQLCKVLKEDSDYWDGWQANIAMCSYDQYMDTFPSTNPAVKGTLLKIFNEGANRFLKLLTSKKGEENG